MTTVSQEWRDLLCLIPGYDPFRSAGDAWFDAEAAQFAIDFIQECIKHVEGDKAGTPFLLEPWQKAFVGNLFGWKRKDALGRVGRRYRESLLYVPRKNGKTPLCAAIALCIFFTDAEAGQQDYIAAADREQAGMLFRQAKGMVEAEPQLSARCRIYGGNAQAGQSRSIVKDDNSFLRVVSADANTKHGGNAHLVLVDELHAQKSRDLLDTLTTSTASLNRKQTLVILLTTADFDRPSICNEKHDYACKVRDGIVDDPAFLPVIYESAKDADWKDREVWRKANPNLGVSVSEEYLERECKRAQEVPAYENTFRRLHLDQRTEQAERIIPMDRWDACPAGVAAEELHGDECFGGLDLGATSDFTALALLFPRAERRYRLLPFFWLPSNPVRRDPRMAAQIDAWRRQGFIRTTPGDVVDYDLVLADIVELTERYGVKEIAIDRAFQGAQMSTNLQKAGISIVTFGQGWQSMACPTKEFLELVIEGRLEHGKHPVLRWMASNVAAEMEGGPQNMKFSKKKSAEKIDGVIAGVMALGRAMLNGVEQDWYSPGILTN